MPDVPAVGLFLGAPLFHALDALVQLLQQVRILFRLAERLDKRQRKLHIRDGGNGAARRAEGVAQLVARIGQPWSPP